MRTLCLCLLFIAAARFAVAGSDATAANGPKDGVSPKVVNMKDVSHGPGSSQGIGQETPFGYEVSQGHLEDQKVTLYGKGSSGGSGSGGTVPAGSGGGQNSGSPTATLGASFDGSQMTKWIPYDAAIAVGPSNIVVTTNSQLAIYGYASPHALVSLTQFVSLPYGDGFDAKCFYDAVAGHFVVLIDQQSSSTAFMVLGVSQTTDASGAWNWYQLDWTLDGTTPTSNWGDYPSLGYDANAVYIGANQYSFSNSYKYSKVRVISKTELYAATPGTIHWTDFIDLRNSDNTSAFTVKAGRMLSSSASEYLLNTRAGGGSSVTLWRIDNGGNAGGVGTPAPSLTRVATVATSSYSVPPSARQPGGGGVATNDCRTQDVVMQGGVVYTAFTEGYSYGRNTKGAGVRYLQIATDGTKQNDIAYNRTGVDWYFPVVSVDASGDLFMTFSSSSSTQYASMAYTSATTTELASHTLEPAGVVKAGAVKVSYNRWGDYSGIANDPSAGGALWLFCGYAKSTLSGGTTNWGTWIASSSFGTPPAKRALAMDGSAFALHESYPNPFTASTTISYTLARDGGARVAVYDALGRLVRVLADESQSAGPHQVQFVRGAEPAGIYYCRLDAGGATQVRRMYLMK